MRILRIVPHGNHSTEDCVTDVVELTSRGAKVTPLSRTTHKNPKEAREHVRGRIRTGDANWVEDHINPKLTGTGRDFLTYSE